MHATTTKPTSVTAHRSTSTFDAYARYKSLTLDRSRISAQFKSQPKPPSVKPAIPAKIGFTRTNLAILQDDSLQLIIHLQ